MKHILAFIMLLGTVPAQDQIDHLISEVLTGSRDSALIYLPAIERKYPNNPAAMFLKGILEPDGEKAMRQFVDIFNAHPTSDYGDDSVMKVAEYYYAAGLYVQSSEWLKKMPLYYSRSPHIGRAVKLFLNSLIVSGHKDTAIFYSRVFQRQFPNLDVDGKISSLISEYQQSKSESREGNTLRKPVIEHPDVQLDQDKHAGEFSLQTGAFGLKENAEKQRLNLVIGGFDARVTELYRDKKVLYAVRVGYFNSRAEAKKIGDDIKIKLALSTIVVTNQ